MSRIVSSMSPSGSALWPVRWGATWRPCSRANPTTATTSCSSSGTATSVGSWVNARLNARVASSQPAPPGSITAPRMRRWRSRATVGVSRAVICFVSSESVCTCNNPDDDGAAALHTVRLPTRGRYGQPHSFVGVRWRRAQARVPPHDRQPRDRGGVHGAPAPAEGLARLPRGGAGRRRAGGALAPPPGRGRDGDPVRDARSARLPRPRPGVPLRAPRGRLPRPLRDRGRGGVRRPRRPDGRRGPRARRDALRPGRERTPLPTRALGGRREPAARRDAARRRLDDGRRRDRRGRRRRRSAARSSAAGRSSTTSRPSRSSTAARPTSSSGSCARSASSAGSARCGAAGSAWRSPSR